MGDNRRKLNEPLKLSLQLGDGNKKTNQVRVFATVKDPDKVVLVSRFELFDDNDGDYTDENLTLMPDEQSVKVTFEIRNLTDTDQTALYTPQVVTEEFLRDVTGEIVEEGLEGSLLSNDAIEGQVFVSEDLIGALHQEEELQGTVENDTILIGEIDEC